MKTERRDVIKMKSSIKQAYLSLCIRKDIYKITVKDVIEEANISRGTFYAHFLDIIDLKERCEDEYIAEHISALNTLEIQDLAKEPYYQVIEGFKEFKNNADIICGLTNNGKELTFFEKYKEALRKQFKIMQKNHEDKLREITVFCTISIYIDYCQKIVFEQDECEDLELLAQIISRFISGGIFSNFVQN